MQPPSLPISLTRPKRRAAAAAKNGIAVSLGLPTPTTDPPEQPSSSTHPTAAAVAVAATVIVASQGSKKKRVFPGGFTKYDGAPRHSKTHRFEQEQVAPGQERVCSCVKHSIKGCARLATRRIKDDEGKWFPFCEYCLPECYERCCGCHCRECQGCLSPKKRRRDGGVATPPTRPFGHAA